MFKDRRIRTSLIAIAADIVLTGLKAGLAIVTGSAALLADAYHSGADLIVSLVLLGSLFLRYREENRQESSAALGQASAFGFARRVECILAIAVSFVILYVPFEILSELDQRSDETLQFLWVGIGGVLVVIAIVHFMARFKTHVGRETDSPALEADGYHSKIDLFSTIAVLVSLVGSLVGIYLDEIVAIIIAVMIGIAGLELLVSGVRSLIRGDDLDQISVIESLFEWFGHIPIFRFFVAGGKAFVSLLFVFRKYLLSVLLPLLVAAWLLSGFLVVPFGYVGVKERFGASNFSGMESGLHYRLPWPIETVTLLEKGRVLSTTVGSRVAIVSENESENVSNENISDHGVKQAISEKSTSASDKLWRAIKASRVHNDETLYLATGDENLLDIQFAFQYRIVDPLFIYLHTRDVENTVHRFVEHALWREAAQHSFDSILQNSHHEFSDRISKRVEIALAGVGIDVVTVDAQVQMLQPPAMVVPVYRDLLNAFQEKQQRQNRAEAQRAEDLLIANAERVTGKAQVAVEALERKLRAEGEVERFNQLAKVHAGHAEAVEFNQYIHTLVKNLEGKSKVLTDPRIEKTDHRVWGVPGAVGVKEERK
ncbi:Modulator of FtsH protease HflK [Thalassocella blandensis]|nr:Modulator of FtsH protease HflK [Thalassocella blandensis]